MASAAQHAVHRARDCCSSIGLATLQQLPGDLEPHHACRQHVRCHPFKSTRGGIPGAPTAQAQDNRDQELSGAEPGAAMITERRRIVKAVSLMSDDFKPVTGVEPVTVRDMLSSMAHLDAKQDGMLASEDTLGSKSILVMRGLRVRIGVHSGVSDSDLSAHPSNGRIIYAGQALATTTTVCSTGHGGMVVISGTVFELVLTPGVWWWAYSGRDGSERPH